MCAVFVLLSTADALRTGVAFGAALMLAMIVLAMLLYVRARDFIRSNRALDRKMPLLPCIVTLGVAAFFAVVATIHAGAKHSSVAMFPWLPPLDPAPVVGPASPSGGVVALDLLPGESVGPIVCPTNFTYGGDLAVPDWRRGVTLDAAGAVSNFVAFVEAPPDSAAFYRLAPSAAAVADSDGDGLPDAYERIVCRTDPHRADTDGDGDPDGWELDRRLDPLFNPRIVAGAKSEAAHRTPRRRCAD